MAYLLTSERPAAAAMPAYPTMSAHSSSRPVFGWLSWLANARKVRSQRIAQRIALTQLLELDHTRLADLGIERADVLDAIRNPQCGMGKTLASRRANSASAWLQSGRL